MPGRQKAIYNQLTGFLWLGQSSKKNESEAGLLNEISPIEEIRAFVKDNGLNISINGKGRTKAVIMADIRKGMPNHSGISRTPYEEELTHTTITPKWKSGTFNLTTEPIPRQPSQSLPMTVTIENGRITVAGGPNGGRLPMLKVREGLEQPVFDGHVLCQRFCDRVRTC